MTRARRAALLLGLALVLGTLAASDVARREAAIERRLAPVVPRVVAADDLPAGRAVRAADLAVRRIPQRYAAVDGAAAPAEVVGRRLAVSVPAGAYVGATALRDDVAAAPVGRGERAAELIALGNPQWVVPGARVDVLVTREREDGAGRAEIALEDVEVLDASPAARADDGRRRVAATLRVRARQAVYLAGAEAAAREVRLLPRAADDRGRVSG